MVVHAGMFEMFVVSKRGQYSHEYVDESIAAARSASGFTDGDATGTIERTLEPNAIEQLEPSPVAGGVHASWN